MIQLINPSEKFREISKVDFIFVLILICVLSGETLLTQFLFQKDFPIDSILIVLISYFLYFMIVFFLIFMPSFSVITFIITLPLLRQSTNYLTYVLCNTFPINILNIFPLIALFFLIPYKNIKSHMILSLYFIFTIAALPSIFFAINKPLAFTGYYLEIILPFVIYFVLSLTYTGNHYKVFDLYLTISFSFLIAIGYALIEFARSGFSIKLIALRGLTQQSQFLTFSGGYGEPLALGMIFIIFWPVFFVKKERGLKGKFYKVLALSMASIAILTISRRLILVLCFQILLFLLYNRSKVLKFRYLCPIFIILLTLIPIYISRTIGTEAKHLGLIGNIQVDINILYYIDSSINSLKLLLSHPFGIGSLNGNYYWPEISNSFYNWSNPILSSFLIPFSSIWIHYGLFPYISFILILYTLLKKLRKVMKSKNIMLSSEALGLYVSLISCSLLSILTINVSWRGNIENTIYPNQTQPSIIYGLWTSIFLFLCSYNYLKYKKIFYEHSYNK